MDNIDKFYSEFNRLRPPQRGIKTPIRHEGAKLKPNQKCPCGSKKKYKKCCQQRLEEVAREKGSNLLTLNEVADHD